MKLVGINDKIITFDQGHAMNIDEWEDWMDDDMDVEDPSVDDIIVGFEAPDVYEPADLKKAADNFMGLQILSLLDECEGLYSWHDTVSEQTKYYYVYFRLDKWKQLKERLKNE